MNRYLQIKPVIFFGVSLVVIFTSLLCHANTLELQQRLNRLLDKYPHNHIAVKVVNLKNHRVIFSHNASRLFIPASNLKLFTTLSSLVYLGEGFRFKTEVSSNHIVNKQGVIKGDIYFNFSGDPSFTSENLFDLIVQLKRHGIKKIEGNIIIVANQFGSKLYGPGWSWDDENSCFSAPTSSVVINENCFKYNLYPAKKIAHLARGKLNSFQNFVSVKNIATTISHKNPICPLELQANQNNQYELSGCISIKRKVINLDIAVKNPILLVTALMKNDFQRLGIKLQGKIITGELKHKPIIIVEHQSFPLTILIQKMLKESDNLYADVLFKTMGKHFYKGLGTWYTGKKAELSVLKNTIGLNPKSVKIVDGAGGSRYNVITPNDVIHLLEYVYQHPTIRQAFFNALPIAGVDGTLSNRMQANFIKGRVSAKTGTMQSVSNLSGFLHADSGHYYAFSIMINGFIEKPKRYEKLEDKICQVLVKFG